MSEELDRNQCSNQVLVNRERVLALGGFDEKIPAMQDHDMWVRLIAEYGDAYRINEPTYVVNDDRVLERISSLNNKLNAIKMFEEKHGKLMSKRNKKNLAFYKQKVSGEKFSVFGYFSSLRYGLWELKTKHLLATIFKGLSKKRLDYLASGKEK